MEKHTKICIIPNSFINFKVNSFKYAAGNGMASFSGKKTLSRPCWCSLIFLNCFLKKMGPIIYSQRSLEFIIHLRKGEMNWVISELLFGSAFTSGLPEKSQCILDSGQKELKQSEIYNLMAANICYTVELQQHQYPVIDAK